MSLCSIESPFYYIFMKALRAVLKMMFSVNDFFGKCEQIFSFLEIFFAFTKKIINGKHRFLHSDAFQFYQIMKF